MSTFLKEESKDVFYGQFDNVKSEKLEYDMAPLYENMPDNIQGEHVPILAIDCAPGDTLSSTYLLDSSFDCTMCDKTFKHKKSLVDHINRKHTGTSEDSSPIDFGCTFCGKTFSNSYTLHRHIVTHTSQQVPCRKQNCNQMFDSESDMRRHIEQDHLDKKYSCRVCSKMFTRVSNLNRHMKLHQNIREFPCTLCGKEFTQRVHRDKHMMIHFRTSNQCPKCDTVYTKVQYFNNHVTNVCFPSHHHDRSRSPPRKEATCTYTLKCPKVVDTSRILCRFSKTCVWVV